jgi:hypothetical protein
VFELCGAVQTTVGTAGGSEFSAATRAAGMLTGRPRPACNFSSHSPASLAPPPELAQGSAREPPAPEQLGPAAGSTLYQYVLYFSYSGYSQTFLDAVFDADHDARISSGQGRRQLAAFQRQSRARGAISPLAGGWRAGSPFWLI